MPEGPPGKESPFYEALGGGAVSCLVCERRCRLPSGVAGPCKNYKNVGGRLYHVGYGKLSAVELRPIEIKPLFHYWPNSVALTYSNYGCNFYCPWCQNDHLSFAAPPEGAAPTPPPQLAALAAGSGADGLSASFNEPITNLDYVIDATVEARRLGLYSMMVTNMYFTPKSLERAIEAGVDGFSVDVKGCPGMRPLAGVDHNAVLRNAQAAIDRGAHVELVYLVVPGANDSEECYKWVIGRALDLLGPDVPLHINRYFPAHRWRAPPTPVELLLKIKEEAQREGLKFVYVGNLHDPELEATRCPRCGKVLIRRRFYRVTYFGLEREGGRYRCPRCGETIPITGRYVPGRGWPWA